MSVAKEPDWWLSPADIFNGMGGGAGFPTLALEVGVSESYSQLCKDAQWWYSNSDHLTKCVVIVVVTCRSHADVWFVRLHLAI
ncbi:uncharacterized protein N7518_004059 [Penicillium psychrosexuale]|uniref:uncharacterized protein n=1 Tax=Penicillium psychrosexuale TaxID=1002107 RepID=UPI002545B703|nr:uncharacterized protein N7518_004059 [Penicillium psychrosexuale]KAJ5795519.1 hypothetical protein N7518_004059 [Penicillium psychrosexuale]